MHMRHRRVPDLVAAMSTVKRFAQVALKLLADANAEVAYWPLAAERWQSPV